MEEYTDYVAREAHPAHVARIKSARPGTRPPLPSTSAEGRAGDTACGRDERDSGSLEGSDRTLAAVSERQRKNAVLRLLRTNLEWSRERSLCVNEEQGSLLLPVLVGSCWSAAECVLTQASLHASAPCAIGTAQCECGRACSQPMHLAPASPPSPASPQVDATRTLGVVCEQPRSGGLEVAAGTPSSGADTASDGAAGLVQGMWSRMESNAVRADSLWREELPRSHRLGNDEFFCKREWILETFSQRGMRDEWKEHMDKVPLECRGVLLSATDGRSWPLMATGLSIRLLAPTYPLRSRSTDIILPSHPTGATQATLGGGRAQQDEPVRPVSALAGLYFPPNGAHPLLPSHRVRALPQLNHPPVSCCRYKVGLDHTRSVRRPPAHHAAQHAAPTQHSQTAKAACGGSEQAGGSTAASPGASSKSLRSGRAGGGSGTGAGADDLESVFVLSRVSAAASDGRRHSAFIVLLKASRQTTSTFWYRTSQIGHHRQRLFSMRERWRQQMCRWWRQLLEAEVGAVTPPQVASRAPRAMPGRKGSSPRISSRPSPHPLWVTRPSTYGRSRCYRASSSCAGCRRSSSTTSSCATSTMPTSPSRPRISIPFTTKAARPRASKAMTVRARRRLAAHASAQPRQSGGSVLACCVKCAIDGH